MGPAPGLPVLNPEGLQEIHLSVQAATQQKREQIQRKQVLVLDETNRVSGGHRHLERVHHKQDPRGDWKHQLETQRPAWAPGKLARYHSLHTSWRVTRRLSVGRLDKGVQPG